MTDGPTTRVVYHERPTPRQHSDTFVILAMAVMLIFIYLIYSIVRAVPRYWDSFLLWVEVQNAHKKRLAQNVETVASQPLLDTSRLTDQQLHDLWYNLAEIKQQAIAVKQHATARLAEIQHKLGPMGPPG